MSTSIIEEVSKLTKLEKIELARYLFDEITKEELDDDFELSDEQKAELDRRWEEIENGTAELFTGEQISKELKEKYGITVSLPLASISFT
jgi:putative addiction module component (TIGR02574 family)